MKHILDHVRPATPRERASWRAEESRWEGRILASAFAAVACIALAMLVWWVAYSLWPA